MIIAIVENNDKFKCLLKQWMVFFTCSDWLLILEISSAIH